MKVYEVGGRSNYLGGSAVLTAGAAQRSGEKAACGKRGKRGKRVKEVGKVWETGIAQGGRGRFRVRDSRGMG